MPPTADQNARERLGRLLTERRVQIDARYANRRTFAAERGMNWRTLHDIELAKRDNFSPRIMRAFETAYMLVPGSLDRTLAGGDLEPLPVPSAAPPAPRNGGPDDDAAALFPGDLLLQAVWRMRDLPAATEEERQQHLSEVDAIVTTIARKRRESRPDGHAATG